ncbi:MAG TPA: X-Pro aminopeptidase, partial [Cytophagales bacterium]|nr:X-Pro aminopeptidase [Cytophagales bacterium]
MRYSPAPAALYIRNRKRLTQKLKLNALALFNSNDIMPTNADGTMAFRQNNNLLYLSGVDQEESILILCPDFPDKRYREVLFLR